MNFAVKDKVYHLDFGPGIVKDVLGEIVIVDFSGEQIDVHAISLKKIPSNNPVSSSLIGIENMSLNLKIRHFRRAFEALNLGVVPPDPDELLTLSIGGDTWRERIDLWLDKADIQGLCKVVFGHYGDGKSHILHLARSTALKAGWVVAYVEFDPKTADPSKPHLIYRNLVASLVFPKRDDGTVTRGFRGFIKEVREKWGSAAIRYNSAFLSTNSWFREGLDILMRFPHSEEDRYVAACAWLAGENEPIRTINSMAIEKGVRTRVPTMPRSGETAEIYVMHLVTIHHLCRELGYKGLLVVVDEAEHVRGYNVHRRERANNFFDLLARSAHSPRNDFSNPIPNDHGLYIPKYWEKGPHFSLLVGLTPSESLGDNPILDAANVFIFNEEDEVTLIKPEVEDYEKWCRDYFGLLRDCYPLQSQSIAQNASIDRISRILRNAYADSFKSGIPMRHWTKLCGLVGCMILAGNADSEDKIISAILKVSQEYKYGALPWR